MKICIKRINNCIWAFCLTFFVASAVTAGNWGEIRREMAQVNKTAASLVLPGGPSQRGIQPVKQDGNPECTLGPEQYEFKINDPSVGVSCDDPEETWTKYIGPNGFVVSICASDEYDNGPEFGYSANSNIFHLIVKGGPVANRYQNVPPNIAPWTWDAWLHSPINPNNGNFYGLSHITFCFDRVPSIEVTKECTAGQGVEIDPLMFEYKVEGKITNTGVGTLDNIQLSDSPEDFEPPGPVYYACNASGLPTGDPLADQTPELDEGESVCYRGYVFLENGAMDTVTVTADTVDDFEVTDNAKDTCPIRELIPEIEVIKDCDAGCLEPTRGVLVARVDVHGGVCNKSNFDILDLTVEDNEAGILDSNGSTDGTIPVGTPLQNVTLKALQCVRFKGTYYPGSAHSIADPRLWTLKADDAQFLDKVTVTGRAPTEQEVSTLGMDSADCPLCDPLARCPDPHALQ